jgi:hypothetical protein
MWSSRGGLVRSMRVCTQLTTQHVHAGGAEGTGAAAVDFRQREGRWNFRQQNRLMIKRTACSFGWWLVTGTNLF